MHNHFAIYLFLVGIFGCFIALLIGVFLILAVVINKLINSRRQTKSGN